MRPPEGDEKIKCSVNPDREAEFFLRQSEGWAPKSWRSSLLDPPMLKRSAKVSLVVGTLLVALNEGDQIVSGEFPWSAAWWKVVLTYCVPFGVAAYGALSNGQISKPKTDS